MPFVLVLGDQHVPIERALVLGADASCDVVVIGLEAKHVRFEPKDEWLLVRPEGDGVVAVNAVRVLPGEARAILPGDRVLIGSSAGKVAYEETVLPAKTAELALAAIERARSIPRVLVVGGQRLGAHFDLGAEGQAVRVGRGKESDWILDDDSLSRAHVRLVLRSGRVLVRDLASSRGTFLGTSRLDPEKDATWDPSRALRIGDTVLALLTPASIEEVVRELVHQMPEAPALPPKDAEEEGARRDEQNACAPLMSARSTQPTTAADVSTLRTRVVVAGAVMLIIACIASLLWVLGVFSG